MTDSWFPVTCRQFASNMIRELVNNYQNYVMLFAQSIQLFDSMENEWNTWLKNNKESPKYKDVETWVQYTKSIRRAFENHVENKNSYMNDYENLFTWCLHLDKLNRERNSYLYFGVSSRDWRDRFPIIDNPIHGKIWYLSQIYEAKKDIPLFLSTLCECILLMKKYIHQHNAYFHLHSEKTLHADKTDA